MIRPLAFFILLVGALGATSVAVPAAAENGAAARCVRDGLPKAFCSDDSEELTRLYAIWRAAADRLEASDADLSFSRDPGSEGYGLPIESVRLTDVANLDPDDPEPHPARLAFIRRSISTRDIGTLADRATEGEPEAIALARSLPVKLETADLETCPAARARLDALESLLAIQLDVPGVGRDADILPRTTFDPTYRYRLSVTGRLPDGTLGKVEYEMDDPQPLARWQSEMFKLLEPCWRPADPRLS